MDSGRTETDFTAIGEKKMSVLGRFLRYCIGGFITICAGIALWGFTSTTEIPKVYATKDDVHHVQAEVCSKVYQTNARIDRIEDNVIIRLDALDNKIDTLILKFVRPGE